MIIKSQNSGIKNEFNNKHTIMLDVKMEKFRKTMNEPFQIK